MNEIIHFVRDTNIFSERTNKAYDDLLHADEPDANWLEIADEYADWIKMRIEEVSEIDDGTEFVCDSDDE